MQRHELAPVGERRLDLDLVEQLGDARPSPRRGRSTARPSLISSDTVASPSRARSSTQHDSSAVASGALSSTPRSRRSRATIPATDEQQLLLVSDGVRRISELRRNALDGQQLLHALALERLGRAGGDDPPDVHDRVGVGEAHREVDVLLDEQDRHPVVA